MGHLDRLARLLLIAGLIALGASTLLTWVQLQGGGRFQSGLALALIVQVLTALAGAMLTGAAFAYVMRAVKLDQSS